MTPLTFYTVDVFAVDKYTGNQLAVFPHASHLSPSQMQRLALEINYSETTFITSTQPDNGGYNVRIFTPKKELPFAGHPTLGTAYIIQREIIQEPVAIVNLNLQVGQIPVSWDRTDDGDEVLWMRQNPPTFHQIFTAADLAPILNLEVDEIDNRYPIQEVSTGVPFIIVPLKNHTALKRSRINREKYFQFIENTYAKEILIFCRETYSSANQLSVRVFADSLGIPEDPATGSANGCLAGYLVKYDYLGDGKEGLCDAKGGRSHRAVDVRVEQGYEIDRPSLLFLKARSEGESIQISVGGKVIMVAKGEFV